MEVEAFFESKTYKKTDFKKTGLPKGEYDGCKFIDCDLSELNLSGVNLMDCQFSNCNLSMVKLSQTGLRDVKFDKCKMLGLYFDQCQDIGFSVNFEECDLSHSSFYKLSMKKNHFKLLKLHEVDFSEVDLSLSVFEKCDFLGAVFDNTNLEKADFRSSYNYSIDPSKNKIKKAKFSLNGIVGLLDKYDIEIDYKS